MITHNFYKSDLNTNDLIGQINSCKQEWKKGIYEEIILKILHSNITSKSKGVNPYELTWEKLCKSAYSWYFKYIGKLKKEDLLYFRQNAIGINEFNNQTYVHLIAHPNFYTWLEHEFKLEDYIWDSDKNAEEQNISEEEYKEKRTFFTKLANTGNITQALFYYEIDRRSEVKIFISELLENPDSKKYLFSNYLIDRYINEYISNNKTEIPNINNLKAFILKSL